MKKKQTKKNLKQNQKNQLNQTQLLKLLDDQHRKGSYKDYSLPGLSFAKIPIYTFTPEINKYLQKYPNETLLGFTKCYLNNLDGLEFPGEKVISITMNYNNLKGDSLLKISKLFPNITHLDLSHNQIAQIQDLNHLNNFKKLEHLDLCFNPVKRYKDYRKIIFEQIPGLKNLDDDQEIDDSEDNSSRDNWLSSEVEDSDDSFDGSSSGKFNRPNKRKRVKH